MRASREQDTDHFDFLPFIAILMCTLGCLLFVTLSIAAMSLGPARGEGWIPVIDKSFNKTPVLLEWDGANVVIHQLNGKIVTVPYASGEFYEDASGQTKRIGGDVDPTLREFLNWMKKHKSTYYPLIAIRPSGFANMWNLFTEFETQKIVIGYEPIGQKRAVRLLEGVKR